MRITLRVNGRLISWMWLWWPASFCRGEAHYPYYAILLSVPCLCRPLLCVSCSVSRPDKMVFPPSNWTVHQSLMEEQDIGPELHQVFEARTQLGWSRMTVNSWPCCCCGHLLKQETWYQTELFCFQLVNNGPSAVSHSTLEVRCPLRTPGHELLYPVEMVSEGPLTCFSKPAFNALKLKVRTQMRSLGFSLF